MTSSNNELISINLNTNNSNGNSSRKYADILNLLKNHDSLTYNYALKETIDLMENLVAHPNEEIINIDFVFNAGKCLLDYKWDYYMGSLTIVRLELFLRAMSSVLHIVSQHVDMIESSTRTSLYKSISKFWAVYRNTKFNNANIMFILREIRTCLRKIKDDRTLVSRGGDMITFFVSIIQKEYMNAFGSFISMLNFEYAAGSWYHKWKESREKYFELRGNYLEDDSNYSNLKEIKRFYKRLYKSSIKEWDIVQRKNTKFRNFEYKILKSGGMAAGCSLPDHIDTLLIGYLDLIQRLLMEFFPRMKRYIERTVELCHKIVDTHIKKQLTFKAVEILYVIKENSEEEEIKNEIESNFDKWMNFSFTSQPLSVSPQISDDNCNFSETDSTSSKFIDSAPPQLPDTPTSAYTSFSTPPQSYLNPPPTPTLSQEERRGRQRRLNVRKIPTEVTTYLSNFQKVRQQRLFNTRKRIVEDVDKLFTERDKINSNIDNVKIEYNNLLKNDETIDENSILSKLMEILKEKENVISTNKEKEKNNEAEEGNNLRSESSGIRSGSPKLNLNEVKVSTNKNNEVEEGNNLRSESSGVRSGSPKLNLDEKINDKEKVKISTNKDAEISCLEGLEEKEKNNEAEEGNNLNAKEINHNEKVKMTTSKDVNTSHLEGLEENEKNNEAEKDNNLNAERQSEEGKKSESSVRSVSPELILDEEINDKEKVEISTNKDVEISYLEDLEEKEKNNEVEEGNNLNAKDKEKEKIIFEKEINHNEEVEMTTSKDVDTSHLEGLEENEKNNEAEENNNLNAERQSEEGKKSESSSVRSVSPELISDEEINDKEKVEIGTNKDVEISHLEGLEEKKKNNEAEEGDNLNAEDKEEECRKSEEGKRSESSVGSQNIILDEKINNNEKVKMNLESKEDESKEDKGTHLIVNHYHVTNVTNVQQQPGQYDDHDEDSTIFRTIKRFVKEVEYIVEKASKAHRAAVSLRLSNNSSSVSIDKVEKEKEDIKEKEIGKEKEVEREKEVEKEKEVESEREKEVETF